MTRETSQALALIRWPLIMCIVAVHVFAPGTVSVHGTEFDLASVPEFAGLWKCVSAFLMENGVATFFFISGYLFFTGGEMTLERYRTKVRSRVRSLAVPYLIWNAIAVLFLCMLALPVFRRFLPEFELSRFIPSAGHLFKGFVMNDLHGYPHNAPMWFLRDLMLCVALALPVNYLMDRTRWAVVGLLGALCLYLYTQPPGYPLLIVSALFFFYFGGYLAKRGHDLLGFFSRWKYAAYILYPLLGVAFMYADGVDHRLAMFIKSVNLMVVIALAVNLAGYLVRHRGMRANRFLNGATFFVFAAHFIGLDYYRKILLTAFHPQSGAAVVAVFIAGYFLLLGFLLLTYFCLDRLAPRVAAVLTGKRSS